MDNSNVKRDGELMKLVATGDETAFAEIIQIYSPQTKRLLQNRYSKPGSTISRDDIDDAVQKSFAILWKNASQYDGKHEVGAFLYTIALNECKQAHKKNALKTELPNSNLGMRDQDIYNQTLLNELLQKLSDEYRTIVTQKSEGHTFDEISSALGIPRATVHRKYLSALTTMQENAQLPTRAK